MPIFSFTPDLNGQEVQKYLDGEEGFVADMLAAMAPGDHHLMVINGTADREKLQWIASELNVMKLSCLSAMVSQPGVIPALLAGYERIINSGFAGASLKIDTAEHPIAYGRKAAERARDINGLVVADLVGPELKILSPGTPDAVMHNLFRLQYAVATTGRLPLSSGHDLTGISTTVLEKVYDGAVTILDTVKELNEKVPEWGFQAMMDLAACAQDIPTDVIPISGDSETPRNRSAKKGATQYYNHALIIEAFTMVYPHMLPVITHNINSLLTSLHVPSTLMNPVMRITATP